LTGVVAAGAGAGVEAAAATLFKSAAYGDSTAGVDAEYPCSDEGIPLFTVVTGAGAGALGAGNVLTGLFTVVFGAYRSL